MDIGQEIKIILLRENINLSELNDKINRLNNTDYTLQNLSRKLKNNTLKFKEIEQILDILGYEIEIKSKAN